MSEKFTSEWYRDYLGKQNKSKNTILNESTTARAIRDKKQREEADVKGIGKSPKSQCSPSDVPLVTNEDKKDDSKRIKISYSVFRKRFCDPDNIFLKWHTDALRYEGLIQDDRYEDIEIRVQQFKSKEEYVEIEIIYPIT